MKRLLLVWLVMTGLAIAFVTRYAARHRVAPETFAEVATGERHPRQLAVLTVLAGAIVLLVVGALEWGWGLLEMGGLFLAVAVLAGAIGGLRANRTAEVFVEGLSSMTGGALVVGLALATLILLDNAQVTDTILHAMAGAVAHLPGWATVTGIYGVQVALSYLVPSGSGQAALTMPILAPLGDLVGVTRQTSVLAYQFGDGFSNIFTPTSGYFMAGLALINVSWTRWVRFLWPLQLMWLAAGFVFLLIAQAIRWGPF